MNRDGCMGGLLKGDPLHIKLGVEGHMLLSWQ